VCTIGAQGVLRGIALPPATSPYHSEWKREGEGNRLCTTPRNRGRRSADGGKGTRYMAKTTSIYREENFISLIRVNKYLKSEKEKEGGTHTLVRK